jgi:outer membrane protein assembly factor BamB
LVTITVFGEHLFDLSRCDSRAWIAAVGFAVLCLVQARLFGRSGNGSGRGLGWLALCLAVLTVVGLPDKEHTFHGELFNTSGMLVWVVAGIPLTLSAFWLLAPAPRYARRDALVIWEARATARAGVVALLAAGVAAGIIQCALSPGYYPDGENDLKIVAWKWMGGAIVPLLVSVAVSSHRPQWLWPRWLESGAVSLLAVVAGLKLLEALAAASSLFRYHLGAPRWQAAYPIWGIVSAAVLAVAVGLTLGRGRASWFAPAVRAHIFAVLAIAAAALCLGLVASGREERLHDSWVRAIVCLDRQTGQIRWVAEGLTGPRSQLDRRNSAATPTPLADRDKLVGYFGPTGLFCVNTRGDVLWRTHVVQDDSFYGTAVSPVSAEGVVIVVAVKPAPEPSVWAFDLETGAVFWKQPWPGETRALSGCNRTPLIRTIKDSKHVIIWANHTVRSLDLHTGAEAWSFELPPTFELGDNVASMVADENQLYLPGMRETIALSLEALAAGREPIRWRVREAGANCASPVHWDGKLFLISDSGTAVCLAAQTGKELGRKRLRGQFMASPIAAGGHVYFIDTRGCTTVVSADGRMDTAMVNGLAEDVYASPAVANGFLYLRTIRTLHCIGAAPAGTR